MKQTPENDLRLDWLDLCCGQLPVGKQVKMPMLSGSMMPLFAPGSEILIESISWKDCQPGEVIVYSLNDSLTAHRLLLHLPMGRWSLIYQKGDWNQFGNWTRSRRVVGKVVANYRQDGTMVDMVSEQIVAEFGLQVRRQLYKDIRNRVLYLPRKVKRWLIKTD